MATGFEPRPCDTHRLRQRAAGDHPRVALRANRDLPVLRFAGRADTSSAGNADDPHGAPPVGLGFRHPSRMHHKDAHLLQGLTHQVLGETPNTVAASAYDKDNPNAPAR